MPDISVLFSTTSCCLHPYARVRQLGFGMPHVGLSVCLLPGIGGMGASIDSGDIRILSRLSPVLSWWTESTLTDSRPSGAVTPDPVSDVQPLRFRNVDELVECPTSPYESGRLGIGENRVRTEAVSVSEK